MRKHAERELARRAMALLLVVAGAAAALFLLSGNAAASAAPAATDAPDRCANGVVVPQPAANPELVADCAVLLDLQPTLAGTATLNWGANTALSSWDGITVASLDGIQRVTELDMDGQGLNGTIPAQLGQLSGLRELRLAWGNQLTGSIPAELGRLTRLTFLNLAANHLSGPIPPELGSIGPQLTHLVLSAPQPLPDGVGLTGSIPAQLGNLSGLTSLYLDGNRLTGSIPPRLGRLLNLSWLHLTRNQLTGALPTQLSALTNLTNLRLEDNRLSGPIPSQLSRLTNPAQGLPHAQCRLQRLRSAPPARGPLQRHRHAQLARLRLGRPGDARDSAAGLHPDRDRRRRAAPSTQRASRPTPRPLPSPSPQAGTTRPTPSAAGPALVTELGHDLHAGAVRRRQRLAPRSLRTAGGRAATTPDRRRLHPRRLPGRSRGLCAGPGHPRRAVAHTQCRRSLRSRARPAGHGRDGGAIAVQS